MTFDRDTGLPELLRKEFRKFKPLPDTQVMSRGVAALPADIPLGGGGAGGAPTVVVAAFDATEESKARADFRCTGVDDHTTINAAIAVLKDTGGRVLLTEGTFWVQTNQIDLDAGGSTEALWLQGMDWVGTVIRSTDTSGSLVAVADNSQVTDIYFASGGLTDTIGIGGTQFDIGIGTGGNDVYINRCGFQNIDTAIRLSGNRWHISDCKTWLSVDWFVADRDDFIDTIVTNNHVLIGLIDMGVGTDWIVSDNYLAGSSIQAFNPERVTISGNRFWSPAVASNIAIIDITGTTGEDVNIVGNAMPNAGWGGIRLDGITRATIVGNSMWNLDIGIEVKNSEGVLIGDNNILWCTHGIVLDGTSESLVTGNMIRNPSTTADNTHDGIFLLGDSNKNFIDGNKIENGDANQPRYGINISASTCDLNRIGDNDYDVLVDYGTHPLNDEGTGTRYPTAIRSELSVPGALSSPVSGAARLPIHEDSIMLDGFPTVGTVPSGGPVTVDLNKNGTTMYGTATNPTVASGQNMGTAAPADPTLFVAGDEIRLDVDAHNGAADLTCVVRFLVG